MIGDDAWYLSEVFWTVTMGLLALFVAAVTLWVNAVGYNKWVLYCWIPSATRLVHAPDGVRDEIRVTSSGRELSDPHVVTVRLLARSRKDIANPQFNAGEPLELNLGTSIVKILDETGGDLKRTISDDGAALLVGPGLIRRRQSTTWRILTEGKPQPLQNRNTLVDVAVKVQDADQAAARRRLSGSIAVSLVVVLLVVLGGVAILQTVFGEADDDTAGGYFGSTVTIGVAGELPRWSSRTGEGFESTLTSFLKRGGGILEGKQISYLTVTPYNRISSLNEGAVDMVIGAASITVDRLEVMDMAGPYYYDRPVVVGNGEMLTPQWRRVDGSRDIGVCLADNWHYDIDTYDRLRAKVEASGGHLALHYEDGIADCLSRFAEGDRVQVVAMDWSIVRAFTPVKLIDVEGREAVDPLGTGGKPSADSRLVERYGVGIRNDHPKVCAALQREIKLFLSAEWSNAFDIYLAGPLGRDRPGGEVPNPHKPPAISEKCQA